MITHDEVTRERELRIAKMKDKITEYEDKLERLDKDHESLKIEYSKAKESLDKNTTDL
jgi:chromosome segregation ATPase